MLSLSSVEACAQYHHANGRGARRTAVPGRRRFGRSPVTRAEILVHPRCRRCETTFPRRVPKHSPVLRVRSHGLGRDTRTRLRADPERADGWYGVQDYENVHPGDKWSS